MIKSKTKITSLALALSLGLTLPALAQETTPEAAPAEGTETAPAEAAPVEDGLSMGTEVGAEPAIGSSYTKATFESWEQRCVKTNLAADPCHLYMLLKDENGQAVAEFSLFNLPEGSSGPAVAGGTLIAPLETLLTTGITIQIDQSKPLAYPFTFCAQMGCVGRLGFTAEELAAFKKGANAVVTIVPADQPEQLFALNVSLKGFTAGFDAVAADNVKADAAAAAAATEAPADAVPAEAPAEAPAN